jgi:TolB-like protein
MSSSELVGPYRLIRLLDEGGMAQVWLAERADGSLKREVALKLPIVLDKRGDLAGRFERERDILAALEHPNIARLYDAGVSPAGLPYLAMEYVRGERLTVWCDAHRVAVSGRLKLVLQVLDALQYAHSHHVIHLDIKPSNILVTESGQVRLLDFGVAKLLTPAERQSQLTVAFGRPLTPEYASPEMARGETVEPASDIYSLGVLLYELLTGCHPYGLNPVPVPSAHVAPGAAALRATTQEKLTRLLRGDLDAIVLKALAKSCSDRYVSAAALADDLQRYLDGQPVQARPDHLTYRLSKQVRRRPVAWAAAGAVVLLVLASLTLALIRAQRPLPATSSGSALNAVAVSAAPLSSAPVSSVAVSSVGVSSVGVNAVTVSAQPDKSIAVLPFVDMSEKKDQEYFSDGLSDELINRLSRSPGLKVIARTSSFQFKGRNEDVRSIAVKLGVAHLLEGSVRKADHRLRVTAQLVRASDGVQLWSDAYDRSLADIFQIQNEISDRVAKSLNATFAIAERPIGRESDVAAYNLVLEGNYYKARRTKADLVKAVQVYKKAIAIRPGYALPWARLASAYLLLEERKAAPTAEDNAKILGALDRALRLDPNLVWTYYTRAGFQMAINWDWAAARADHERMRELDPGNTYLLTSALGDMALVSGRVGEAVAEYQREIEQNPLDPFSLEALGIALCASDRLQECLQYRLKLQQLHPDFEGVASFVGLAHLYLGELPEALAAMEKESERDLQLAGTAMVYTAMGERAESDAALKALKKGFAADDAYEIAQVHAYRGEADAALEWLWRSYQLHNSKVLFVKTDPLLRNLHGDPRFEALVAKLNLPE